MCQLFTALTSVKSEKAVPELNWIGGDISSDRAYNFEYFGHYRFPNSSQLAALDQSLNLCHKYLLHTAAWGIKENRGWGVASDDQETKIETSWECCKVQVVVLPYIYFRDSTTIFPFYWLWYRGNSVTGVVYIGYTCAHGHSWWAFYRQKWMMFETVVVIASYRGCFWSKWYLNPI